jgi:hypothetical protein
MAGVFSKVLPGNQGYLPGPEARVTFRRRAGTRTRTGRIDMAYYHYSKDTNGNWRNIVPFCAEYKAPKLAERPRSWTAARGQLRRYIDGQWPTPPAGRVFGAIIIGRWARFYEYQAAVPNLIPLMNRDPRYHLERQCQTVEGIMGYIRANHVR